MAELTAPADVLTRAFSCPDCHVRALEDEVKRLRDACDSLQQELDCRRRFFFFFNEYLSPTPKVRLVEKVSGMLYQHNLRGVHWESPDTLYVEFSR